MPEVYNIFLLLVVPIKGPILAIKVRNTARGFEKGYSVLDFVAIDHSFYFLLLRAKPQGRPSSFIGLVTLWLCS
jgi:hypothetical protein